MTFESWQDSFFYHGTPKLMTHIYFLCHSDCSTHRTITEVVTMWAACITTLAQNYQLNGPISIHVEIRIVIVKLFFNTCVDDGFEMEPKLGEYCSYLKGLCKHKVTKFPIRRNISIELWNLSSNMVPNGSTWRVK